VKYSSLRKTLIWRLSLSFGITLLLLTPLIYQLIQRPASKAYDQDISDGTRALISHLQIIQGKAHFDFPHEAEQVLRTDSRDAIYYLVLGPNKDFIAGDRDLPVRKALDRLRGSSDHMLYNTVYHEQDLRISAIKQEIDKQPFWFFTAETINKRTELAVDSATAALLSLVVLVIVSLINVWLGISHALVPLDNIRRALHDMQNDRNLKRLSEVDVPTEIKPLVQEFNSLLNRLESSVEIQQRFVANAAHQLRTPLAGVRTQLELLHNETDDAVQGERITQSIQAIARLSHLVHQMLALLSSVPGGREFSTKILVDIAEVIRDRSTEWVRLAAPREIDLGFELESAYVHGDPLLIGEMISNIVDNAVRYTPVGAAVTVRCSKQNQTVIIEVEDNGTGIPLGESELVFERFYRLSTSTSISGSGLGLAIVREVARGLDGDAQIYVPKSGKGCLVRIECPAWASGFSAPLHEGGQEEKSAETTATCQADSCDI
jgi:two-component system sensor histidine kinase TctE